jgi:uroporphyrinogen decarboxylase
MGKEITDKPPIMDYYIDDDVMRVILEKLMGRKWTYPYKAEGGIRRAATDNKQTIATYWDNYIAFWYRMGYDYVRLEMGYDFSLRHRFAKDTAKLSKGNRAWAEETRGLIQSWEDFEKYPWPQLENVDFFPFEYVSTHLPGEMKMIVSHAGGLFEWLTWILSVHRLSILLYDSPELVGAVVDRIGNLMVRFYEQILEVPNICAIFPGDDMGFKTSTIISPKHLHQYILPWHKKFAQMAHAKGLPYFLHSCGDLEEIMDSLIEEVQIDGRHSFEDVILPAAKFKRRYGDKIAILGGVDMDYLSRRSPDEVRCYVRKLIDECAPGGRFAVGASNSVANYVPIENYLTMLDETLKQ